MTSESGKDPRGRDNGRAVVITPAGVLGTLALAAVVLLCIRLGFWQLGRLDERRALNAAVAARLDAPPVEDAGRLADTTGLFYRTVVVAGTFDIERSIVLPGRSHRGVPGVYLLTPLLLDGRSDALLVNRGWVPAADAATIDVDDFDVPGIVSLRGLVLPFPSAAESLAQRERAPAASGGFRRVWFTVDPGMLRSQYPYPLLPVTVQELPAPAPAGGVARGAARYPTRLEPPPLDEGPHLGYALQWFSFALIGIIGWVALVMRSRQPPRIVPPPVGAALLPLAGGIAALLATLAAAAPASAQLRPLDPIDWRVFDPGVRVVGGVGFGVIDAHHATLAGTRGRLLEAGNYALSIRLDRVALRFSGTAIWRLTGETVLEEPFGDAEPSTGEPRQEPGRAVVETLVQLAPRHWPADVVLRFGSTIPTSSDESGLERDRTDFFALLGARFRSGRLGLFTEHGVGINGTMIQDYPQSDVWAYTVGASWRERAAAAVVELVGHQDGHGRRIRGNEDQRELRSGFDIGDRTWLRIRHIVGLGGYSPGHGIRIEAGTLLRRNR